MLNLFILGSRVQVFQHYVDGIDGIGKLSKELLAH